MADSAAAREAALAALRDYQSAPAEVVEYSSAGRLLLIAPPTRESEALAAASEISPPPTVWIADDESNSHAGTTQKNGVCIVRGAARAIDGYLGAFTPRLADGEFAADGGVFDAVADCCLPPLFRRLNPARVLAPPGYIANPDIQAAISEAAELRGVFQKPRYFAYNAAICAHNAAGVSACSRCLEACPAQAITSRGAQKIAVNSYLCQGCGTCALTCPSGAIRYVYPPPRDMLGALRSALIAWRNISADAPLLVFYRGELLLTGDLPPRCLPVAVEEIATIGIEAWFALLAWGAAGVALVADENNTEESKTRDIIGEQINIARAVLQALGFCRDAVFLLPKSADAKALIPASPPAPAPASFIAGDDKREMFFAAVDYLSAQDKSDKKIPIAALPADAPFGEVKVDAKKCTLCMACVGVCPVSALRDGGDAPRLSFVEQNCVQCGLCEAACPEDAISLSPRFVADSAVRRRARVLQEEAPFCCVSCGRPFAAASALAKVEERLAAHRMFQDEAARRRLRMCADCRVKTMFSPKRGDV
jgi:ferredoxin